MILYNGPSRIDGQPIVAIATGYDRPSKNAKTGEMVQVWILARDVNPVSAVVEGKDKSICGTCRHRGTLGNRTCYVNVGKAPRNIWRKYQAGGYQDLTSNEPTKRQYHEELEMFGQGRKIRLGAYGDPAAVPSSVWLSLTSLAIGWTGYTHLWKLRPSLRGLLMASVDTIAEHQMAKRLGWRTFRVKPTNAPDVLAQEIVCPASEEAGKRTVCASCLLCNGNKNDGRKDISILAHGVWKLKVIG